MASRKGGAKDKLQKFPRILDYLEMHHKNVYDLIDELGMHGNLTPRRGGSITFLLPDAEYTKKINKTAESDHPEDATDMLSSLILLDLFEKPEDFLEKKDNIPTLFGTRLMVKGASKTSVEVESGTLTRDKEFVPFSRQGSSKRGNMAVWLLKGEVKYEGVPKAIQRKSKLAPLSRPKKIEGSGERDDMLTLRKRILEEKLNACHKNLKGADGKVICPLLAANCRVLRGLKNQAKDGALPGANHYKNARCLLTMYPAIDFYLLFANPSVFPYADILDAYNKDQNNDNNVDFCRTFCSDLSDAIYTGESALLLQSAHAQEVIDKCSELKLTASRAVNKELIPKIVNIYKDLDTNNKLGDLSPIYTDSLIAVFRATPGLHQMLDEFCWMMFCGMRGVKSRPESDRAKELKILFDEVHNIYGDDFTNPEPKLMVTINSPAMTIDPINTLHHCVQEFWKTFGIHMPCHDASKLEDHVVVGSDEADDPYSNDLVNVDSYIMDDLDHYDNCPACVSDSALAELRAYMRTHNGKLPDSLQER